VQVLILIFAIVNLNRGSGGCPFYDTCLAKGLSAVAASKGFIYLIFSV
jgi:hypothetical protein